MHAPAVEVPAHVPPHLVYDFDFFHPPGGSEDVHRAWKHLHETAPDIFWTPRNGGHWIATRAEDIAVMQRAHERFSHAEFMLPRQEMSLPALPLNLDPPQHAPFRALISPALAPKAVRQLTETARETAIDLIDGISARGGCEFVGDFAKVLPIVVFLRIMDLPRCDRETLLPWADIVVRSPDPAAKLQAHASIAGYLAQWINQRTQHPGDDLISRIAHSSVDGRPLTSSEVFGLCTLLLVGGLDTVAGTLAFAARYLAEHPEHRRELIAQPDLMPAAIEELMRRHALPNTARLITHDFRYKTIAFRKGDMIQLPKACYNLDERLIPDPLAVDFHRPQPVPSATFGDGPHKCPGGLLARNEMRVFLEEWLARIPDFRLRPGFKPRTMSGMVNGIESLELVWDMSA